MSERAEPIRHIVVMTTARSRAGADRIVARLLEARLAACVQMMPIESRYIWEGRLEQSAELLLMIKARAADFPDIEAAIRNVHEYAVPEIIALPVLAGSAPYLAWIDLVTKRGESEVDHSIS
jgi:periplasmic divalent cation tolerance protein